MKNVFSYSCAVKNAKKAALIVDDFEGKVHSIPKVASKLFVPVKLQLVDSDAN